jgi:hypothetical protein
MILGVVGLTNSKFDEKRYYKIEDIKYFNWNREKTETFIQLKDDDFIFVKESPEQVHQLIRDELRYIYAVGRQP